MNLAALGCLVFALAFSPTLSLAESPYVFWDELAPGAVPGDGGAGDDRAAITTADLDGDGKPELAMVETALNRVRIYRVANKQFIVATTLDCASPRNIAVTDFDGDGRADVVVASYGHWWNPGYDTGHLVLFRGLPGLVFAPSQSIPLDGAFAVHAGDINGDGRPDLAAALNPPTASAEFALLIATGGGDYSAPASYPGRAGCVGDLDRDGRSDVLAANQADDSLLVYHGQMDGTLASPTAIPLVPASPVLATDLDGDGAPDVVAGEAMDSFYVLWNDGNGGFATPERLPKRLDTPISMLAAADMDGDGRVDLVGAQESNHRRVAVLWNAGGHAFDESWLYLSDDGSYVTTLALLNYDDDPFTDIVLAWGYPTARLMGFHHLHPRAFAGLQEFAAPPRIQAIWYVTLPGDRHAVYLKEDDSTRVMVGTPAGGFEPPVVITTDAGAYGLDWNGDGGLDLAIPRGDSIEIHLNGGGRKVVPALPAGTFLCNADFDGDGEGDVLLDVPGAGRAIAYRDVALGYTAPVPVTGDAMTGARYAAGDFDGDGRADVAIGVLESAPRDSVVLLHNAGNGEFSSW